jgi:hypothetical protein
MLEEVVAHQPQLLIEDPEQCHTVTRFSTERVGYVRPYITIPATTRVYECWRELDGKVISCHPDTGAKFGFPFKGSKREDGFRMVASDMANPLARDEDSKSMLRPPTPVSVRCLEHASIC